MRAIYNLKIILFYTLLAISPCLLSQQLNVSLTTIDKECKPGEAMIVITGTATTQTVSISWSTGQEQVTRIHDLQKGDYSVHVSAKKQDSLVVISQDTTLNFYIGEKECPVSIANFFSPNGDGYNDVLNIGRVENYPDFDFQVFNKWGQKVHGQRKKFTPWDGTWNGLKLPDGTYYYIFIYDPENPHHHAKGDVTILR